MGEARYLPDYDDDDDAPTLFPAHGSGIGGAIGIEPHVQSAPNVPASHAPSHDPEESGARPTIRPPATSIVRLRVPATDPASREVLRMLGERQIALASSLAWTHARVTALPRDASTRAAALTLLARLSDLGDVRDALNELYCALARQGMGGADRGRSGASLLASGEPLAIHLDGVYRWVLGASEALSILAEELLRLEADWWIFRRRLEDARENYADFLAGAVRSELWAIEDESMRLDLTAAFDDLSFAVRILHTNLDQRFG